MIIDNHNYVTSSGLLNLLITFLSACHTPYALTYLNLFFLDEVCGFDWIFTI